MCRLFGLSGAPRRMSATFWLLDVSDSLAEQSRREPDGTGLGTFTEDGLPLVEKQPIAAYEDRAFAEEARHRESTTFLAHIRYASSGPARPENTHPFLQRGRMLAHNGVIGDLPVLERELGRHLSLVEGDTDSERFLALVTRYTERNGGDVGAGLTEAARWVAENLPVYALNVVLTTPTELWALRYPETHDLVVLERVVPPNGRRRHLDHASAAGTVRVRSDALAGCSSVVVASEPMDESPDWRSLAPGELLHVDDRLRTRRRTVLDSPPRHRLTLDDLGETAARSQRGR
ncbi:class II glutamine amidotransferase [Actinoalloteichus caeruleus]|uniref:Glutamine amidotransferase n=1 Tax=Actinoalloteichus caeruleus DSM 43889 TaxID=1120930 RepID=A0ABT1JKD7_ACTCY|nr:class II glutamine amidotransferase [Actinoalloteichus caeruleus]MCP2332626.1 glutamine amidotransferase [Actinoalloteichus caeruleus DSM 43889]